MLYYIICAVIGYLIGSIPFGYIIVKLKKGVDIRTLGSGNIGATNVGRILGWPFGIIVFLLDATKGFLPIIFLPYYNYCLIYNLCISWRNSAPLIFPDTHHPPPMESFFIMGIAIIIGHLFPIYIKFKGGKGVATALGVFLVLAPISTIIAVGIWLIFVISTQYISLSSIMAAISFFVSPFFLSDISSYCWPYRVNFEGKSLSIIACFIIAILVIIRHIPNIKRLIKGTEPKVKLWGKRKDEREEMKVL